MDAKLLRDGPSSKQETVLSFLGIEVVALICFGFAGATGLTLLRAVGVCIALFLYPLAKNRLAIGSITKKDLYFMCSMAYWSASDSSGWPRLGCS